MIIFDFVTDSDIRNAGPTGRLWGITFGSNCIICGEPAMILRWFITPWRASSLFVVEIVIIETCFLMNRELSTDPF